MNNAFTPLPLLFNKKIWRNTWRLMEFYCQNVAPPIDMQTVVKLANNRQLTNLSQNNREIESGEGMSKKEKYMYV